MLFMLQELQSSQNICNDYCIGPCEGSLSTEVRDRTLGSTGSEYEQYTYKQSTAAQTGEPDLQD